uniref:Root cap n=1 Tax=Fagus sylvatica TaxID=28930 RepID=A0A2N9HPP8_FAGSY
MGHRKLCILVAFFILLVSMDAILAQAQGNGNGNGNNGNGNGNGNNGNGNGNGNNGNGNGNGNNGNGNGTETMEMEMETATTMAWYGNNGNGSGNGNGNGNNGNGNGNGNNGNGNGNGNNGNGNGNGNNGNGNGNGNDNGNSNYDVLPPTIAGQERGMCKTNGACFNKTLVCPSQCPERKPKQNKKQKGCFLDCSSKCEATCKYRRVNCDGYGSVCYDPRFIGGDGVMFYFHGAKGGNFAIVSDDNLQINAHFIGTRPEGRTRDFTWVQALSVMFDTHTLVIAAKRVSHWDNKVDALTIRWDGETINIPNDGEAEWRTNGEEREVVVERTDDANNIKIMVSGLVEMGIRVRPIGEKENRVHHYQLPVDDSFAHLETQFKFFSITDFVEGVLGKTYRPNYVSPVKIGVPMPLMGGEDKYKTPSFNSPICKVCRFQRQPGFGVMKEVAQY